VARYLIDANLPRYFSLWAGEDCEFVHDLGADWSDTRIWSHAATNGLTIVSKDGDFSDRVLLTGERPSVIHIRVGNLTYPGWQSHDGRVSSLSYVRLGGSLSREQRLPARAGVQRPHREH
jgi:predicted nuclease of predicted toxin-antitoxin system